MKDIYIFKNGETVPAKIEKLFETHGPYTIEDRRLDQLVKVQLLVDSSTSTIIQKGSTIDQAKTGSMVGRAIVGGVLTGGIGAVIGGLTGKRESNVNTVSSESLNTDLTAEIIFEDSSSMYVQIRSLESFHWLLSFAGQPSLTDEEITAEKLKAEEAIAEAEKLKVLEAKALAQLKHGDSWIKKYDYIIFISIMLALASYMIRSTLIKEPKQQPNSMLEQKAANLQPQNANFSKTLDTALNTKATSALPVMVKTDKDANNKEETEKILTKLKGITAYQLKENAALYQQLVSYNPEVKAYKNMLDYYTDELKKQEEQLKKHSKDIKNSESVDGFGSFLAVAEIARNELGCPSAVDSDITPPSFDGDGALYGCILGKAETVKWFINENPASKRVINVKFLWNDWFRDMGYGLHSDKQEAKRALKVLIELYAPEKAKELNKLFLGNTNKTITSARFTLKYTYDRGPAIDERMIVVTETKAADSPTAQVTQTKPASVSAVYGDKNPNAAAIVICEGLKSTGNVSNCEVNHFGLLVDATIDTNSIEAKKICVGVASETAKYNSSFNDGKWKFRIFSPYSGDKPIAVCSL